MDCRFPSPGQRDWSSFSERNSNHNNHGSDDVIPSAHNRRCYSCYTCITFKSSARFDKSCNRWDCRSISRRRHWPRHVWSLHVHWDCSSYSDHHRVLDSADDFLYNWGRRFIVIDPKPRSGNHGRFKHRTANVYRATNDPINNHGNAWCANINNLVDRPNHPTFKNDNRICFIKYSKYHKRIWADYLTCCSDDDGERYIKRSKTRVRIVRWGDIIRIKYDRSDQHQSSRRNKIHHHQSTGSHMEQQ